MGTHFYKFDYSADLEHTVHILQRNDSIIKRPYCYQYGHILYSVCTEIFEIRRRAETKTIIIRHPHSVGGSPMRLLLDVSQYDRPEMSHHFNLITGWGSQSPATHNNAFDEWVKCCVCSLYRPERL